MKKLILATALALISGLSATAMASETGAVGTEIERMFPCVPAHNFRVGTGYHQALIADRRGGECEVALSIAKTGADGIEDGTLDTYLTDNSGLGCRAVERAVANVLTWPRLGLAGGGTVGAFDLEREILFEQRVMLMLDEIHAELDRVAANSTGIVEQQIEDDTSAIRVRVVQRGVQRHVAVVRYDDSNEAGRFANFGCVLAAGRDHR